jgi:hypothetical protein
MFKKALSNLCLTESTALLNQQTRSMRVRKPPWVERAKSKRFWVPPLKQEDSDQKAYMKPIHDNYKTQMRSIYQLFKTEAKFSDKESLIAKEEKKLLEEKEKKLLEMNLKRNEEILNEQLMDEERKLEEKKVKFEQEYREKLKNIEILSKLADEKVKKLKEKAKTFVDPNNLEYEIEKALNERHDYNFSVNNSGMFYKNKVRVEKIEAFNSKFIPEPKSTTPKAVN